MHKLTNSIFTQLLFLLFSFLMLQYTEILSSSNLKQLYFDQRQETHLYYMATKPMQNTIE